jgi:hypothetical protein
METANTSSQGQAETADANRPVSQKQRASDRERFELCLAMLKAYYDALEGRVAATVVLFVGIVGWLITAKPARDALNNDPRLVCVAGGTLTLLLVMYGLNIARWVWRWRQVRKIIDSLDYVEPEYYVRYELPTGLWWVYFTPVAVLYAFIMVFLFLIQTGGPASLVGSA